MLSHGSFDSEAKVTFDIQRELPFFQYGAALLLQVAHGLGDEGSGGIII